MGLRSLYEQHQWFGLSKVRIQVRVNDAHNHWDPHSGLTGHKISGLLFYIFQQKMETWQRRCLKEIFMKKNIYMPCLNNVTTLREKGEGDVTQTYFLGMISENSDSVFKNKLQIVSPYH